MTQRVEALGHAVVQEPQQRVEVTAYVQETARFRVHAELGPGEDLEQLLQSPETARQRDEPLRELGHKRFPLVHGADDPEV